MKYVVTLFTALLLAWLATLHAAPAAAEARDFQSLDGMWQIVFDRNNEGGAKQWVREKNFPREQMRDIAVPSCWELMEKDYEGVAFYRHAFKVPANWAGKTVRLHFDAVNFRAEVWLNDTAVGMHEGGFTPFEFRVDDLLKFDGENTLMLRVVGPILMQEKRVDGMGPMETPQWRGAITGGIWQPVRLIGTGDMYVKDVFIEPNKATFFEGLYPVKLAYPDSREMAIREIQLAKDAGFNMIRPWRKPPPPMWLDLADEMGVLTVGSLAVECMDLPIESASLSGWVENEVRESILRDRNRTCVVQWELFNEITERQPNLQRLLHPMSVLARQLDPTRLILDESGGWRKARACICPTSPNRPSSTTSTTTPARRSTTRVP